MTPVSGEVTLCDLNSEEIKPGISESFDCLSKNNLTASNSQLPFSQTSELNVSSTFQRQDTFLSGFFSPSFFFCRSALERLKPQHISAVTKPARWNVPFHAARRKSIKCGDTKKNRFCTIQQAIIKVSASLSNSPVTLDTSHIFLLTSVKGTCDQVKQNLTGTLSGAGVKFWVKKMLIVIKPQHDAFYKSLSRTSRAQTRAGNNRECMLGDERSSSSHIMSRRLLSVRLLVCRVKRRQQRASAEPVWASQHRKASISSRCSHLGAHAHSALYLPAAVDLWSWIKLKSFIFNHEKCSVWDWYSINHLLFFQ